MESLKHFILPLSGLYKGEHQYSFNIGNDFFKQYENSPIKNGSLVIDLFLDKRPDLIELNFELSGSIVVNCDRCTTEIDLPIENTYRSLIKIHDDGDIQDEMEDVSYIPPYTENYDLTPMVYDVICLSIPMIKTIDCDKSIPKPCDLDVLNFLNEEKEESEKKEGKSIWDDLKGLNLD